MIVQINFETVQLFAKFYVYLNVLTIL